MTTLHNIGVHCLELAKTAWNAALTENSVESVDESALLRNAKQFLVLAMSSLTLLGEEGDADTGPLIEAGTLNSLLETSS